MSFKAKSSIVLLAFCGLGFVLSYQNCKPASMTVDSITESSQQAAICPSDQVKDIMGNCIDNQAASKACQFNGQLVTDGTSIMAAESATVPAGSLCKYEYRTCSHGTLSGSYSAATCQPASGSTCTPMDASLASRNLIRSISSSMQEVGAACMDGTVSTVEGSFPTTPLLNLRFMVTCGSRLCVQKGYSSGHLVELGNSVELECYSARLPSTLVNGCKTNLDSLPKFVEFVNLPDSAINQACGLSATPTDTSSIIQWRFHCASMACRNLNQGFDGGRAVENANGTSTLECSREGILNQLGVGTLTAFIGTDIDSVAQSCVDSTSSTVTDYYPSKSADAAVRFYNTCTRRFCQKQGYSTGRLTQINGSSFLQVLCVK